MKDCLHILCIASLGALVYTCAAYTRPHEPAGQLLHSIIDSAAERDAAEELALEVASLRSAGYTLAEVCTLCDAVTDTDCERVAALYYTAEELAALGL